MTGYYIDEAALQECLKIKGKLQRGKMFNMVYSEKSKRYNGRKARIAIALLTAVCLSSSGCIAALYNYDVEIESAEAVSEITAQTPKEAASTDGSETPDAVYQAM